MPKIDLCFQGWLRGAIITEAAETATGNKVDVREMSAHELTQKLDSGELCISLGEHLYESRKAEIEMFDFNVST